MRVLLCPDKFRGSASAVDVSAALAEGIARATPDATIIERPMADGGEGTIRALIAAGWERRTTTVTGPLGETRRANIAVRADEAVVEMAEASGLALLSKPTHPLEATSFGTGELVSFALNLGCTAITIAAGGSASTDGGAGMLEALGARFLDADDRPLQRGGGRLGELRRLDLATLDSRLRDARFTVATDVDSPLCGPSGAAQLFGAQKGAGRAERAQLEAGLRHLAACVAAATTVDHRHAPGAGAGGGLGFAAIALLGAQRTSGARFVIDSLDVPALLGTVDLAVVGEGRLDTQSLHGKAPVEVARLAHQRGVPVVAVCGAVEVRPDQLAELGITDSYSLIERAGSFDMAIRRTHHLLVDIGVQIGMTAQTNRQNR